MPNKGIYKGIYFDDVHSYYDLNLILSPFTPAPASPKTTYVEVTGGNGSLDLSEALGEITYKNRDFSFSFTINPSEEMTFDEKVSQISNLLNGKQCKITFDRDADYYWKGRCVVDKYAQDRNIGKISVKATVEPYKYKQNKTALSFDLTSEKQEIVLQNGRKAVVPEITCTNDDTVVGFGGGEVTLSAGKFKILDIYLTEGNNVLEVSGSGTITFEYQEADL